MRMIPRALAWGVTAICIGTAGCGDDNTPTSPTPTTPTPTTPTTPANRAPVPSGSIPEQMLTVGGDPEMVNVAQYFSDPDGDALTYAATSSADGIVSVGVSAATVTLTPVAVGTATTTVTASDPGGMSATQEIAVTVALPVDPYTPLEGLRVSPGRVQYLFFNAGGCIRIQNTTINGVTYTAHYSKWQRRDDAGSPWEDVPGTMEEGGLCAHNPTSPGEYRLVCEMSIGGERGKYSSENTITR